MLILLYSDTNYVLDGFRAEFFVTNCPNNCSDHGMCSPLHKCYCEGTWGGVDCGLDLCPEGCGRDQQRGECKMNRCRCERGYSGQACSLYRGDQTGNKWVLRFEVMALAKMPIISRLKAPHYFVGFLMWDGGQCPEFPARLWPYAIVRNFYSWVKVMIFWDVTPC